MRDLAPTILITDDDRAFRETLGSIFAPRGFQTHLAADGEEAIRIVRQKQIHLALLDFHMPRLTGLQTVEAVREFNAGLPCILISGGLDEQLRQQAAAADVFDVLEKPVQVDVVTSVVANAFAQTYDWVF